MDVLSFSFWPEAQSPVRQSQVLVCPPLLWVPCEQRVHLRGLDFSVAVSLLGVLELNPLPCEFSV